MRSFAPAALACLALAAGIGGWLMATAAHGGSTPPPAAPAAMGSAPAAATAPIDNVAPIRHARRRACLKEAKSKRLVGTKRAAYVKSCMGPT